MPSPSSTSMPKPPIHLPQEIVDEIVSLALSSPIDEMCLRTRKTGIRKSASKLLAYATRAARISPSFLTSVHRHLARYVEDTKAQTELLWNVVYHGMSPVHKSYPSFSWMGIEQEQQQKNFDSFIDAIEQFQHALNTRNLSMTQKFNLASRLPPDCKWDDCPKSRALGAKPSLRRQFCKVEAMGKVLLQTQYELEKLRFQTPKRLRIADGFNDLWLNAGELQEAAAPLRASHERPMWTGTVQVDRTQLRRLNLDRTSGDWAPTDDFEEWGRIGGYYDEGRLHDYPQAPQRRCAHPEHWNRRPAYNHPHLPAYNDYRDRSIASVLQQFQRQLLWNAIVDHKTVSPQCAVSEHVVGVDASSRGVQIFCDGPLPGM